MALLVCAGTNSTALRQILETELRPIGARADTIRPAVPIPTSIAVPGPTLLTVPRQLPRSEVSALALPGNKLSEKVSALALQGAAHCSLLREILEAELGQQPGVDEIPGAAFDAEILTAHGVCA